MYRTRLFRTARRLTGVLAALAAALLATATTAQAAVNLPQPPMASGKPSWQTAITAMASGERAAHAVHYPRAFIEWKLSAGSPQQYA